jgi:predicted Zn-dependent protease
MKLSENFKKRLQELASILSEEKNNDTYFETLSQALDKVLEKATKQGYEIEDQEREFFLFGVGGISYGQTKQASFNLLRDGKPTKKKLQVQIYRMDSGRYELNQYIA